MNTPPKIRRIDFYLFLAIKPLFKFNKKHPLLGGYFLCSMKYALCYVRNYFFTSSINLAKVSGFSIAI